MNCRYLTVTGQEGQGITVILLRCSIYLEALLIIFSTINYYLLIIAAIC